jgi:hypothetical protein
MMNNGAPRTRIQRAAARGARGVAQMMEVGPPKSQSLHPELTRPYLILAHCTEPPKEENGQILPSFAPRPHFESLLSKKVAYRREAFALG